MEFFVPNVNGDGKMPPDEAEDAWQACRKGAETDMGRDALARRVYRLRYVHNGHDMEAIVGQREQYYDRELIMAIVAFPSDVYSVRCVVRGYLKIGDPIIVGESELRDVEDFDQDAASPSTTPLP